MCTKYILTWKCIYGVSLLICGRLLDCFRIKSETITSNVFGALQSLEKRKDCWLLTVLDLGEYVWSFKACAKEGGVVGSYQQRTCNQARNAIPILPCPLLFHLRDVTRPYCWEREEKGLHFFFVKKGLPSSSSWLHYSWHRALWRKRREVRWTFIGTSKWSFIWVHAKRV